MGRVYTALVKADRWKDRGYRIGQPADSPAHYPQYSEDDRVDNDAAYETDDTDVFGIDDAPRMAETAFEFNDSIALIERIAAA